MTCRDRVTLRSIILFSLAPGHFPEPDHRSFERLARVACDFGNAFASLVPEPVRSTLQGILDEHPDSMAHRAVASWWRINERSAFFRHSQTARVIRHMLLIEDQAGADPGAEVARKRWRR